MAFSCRLCLEKYSQDKLKNVFQCNVQHAEDSLVNILFWVFSVEIDVTDQFSKEICCDCFQLIEYILQARKTFQDNQTRLRNYLQNQCKNLEDQFVCGTDSKKISNLSSPSRSATNSLSRSRYTPNNLYGSCSPRVRVSLSTIEAMCPASVNIVPVEDTQEYLRYRQLKNGTFKKRKYRHFNMDDSLLNEICSSLDRTQIDVSTENLLVSRVASTDDIDTSTHENDANLSVSNKTREHFSTVNENTHDEENFLESVGIISKLDSLLASPGSNQEYDWTSLTFKKDASVNTESDKPNTKDVGINAIVQTVTTGTLTKRFKQMKKKNVVRVNIESLDSFGPSVIIEPLTNILKEENYKQIGKFRFVKTNSPEDDEEESDNSEESQETQPEAISSKKQKFLDYYKNFSSFAVRELITGKKIRDSDTSPVFRLDHSRNVFVCEFCSRSFLTRISLSVHCKKRHKTMEKDNIIDLVNNVNSITIRRAKIQRRTGKMSSSDTERKDESLETEEVHENLPKLTEEGTDNETKGLRKRSHSILYNDDIRSGMSPNQVPIKMKRKKRKHNFILKRRLFSKALKTSADTSNDRTSDEHHNIDEATKTTTVKEKSCDNIIENKIKLNHTLEKTRKVVKPNVGNRKNSATEDEDNTSYAWHRKGLGKYSAISYYQNNLKNDNKTAFCDQKEKKDQTLNETIQKLVTRLDNTNSEESYSEDFFS